MLKSKFIQLLLLLVVVVHAKYYDTWLYLEITVQSLSMAMCTMSTTLRGLMDTQIARYDYALYRVFQKRGVNLIFVRVLSISKSIFRQNGPQQ